jgi:ParB/RepB/Spo0J family partition protein
VIGNRVPPGLAIVPIDLIQPCPIQPRVNVSVDLVAKLSDSIRSGRHQPLLEVEPAPGMRGRYQIVFGEQRWRAAKAAGLLEILVRVHPHLGYLERLEKQYEENHLRANLDAVEEAHCIVVDKTIRDIAIAEQLLRHSLVPFKPLDEKRIVHRQEFVQHLDGLRELLVKHKTHIVKGADGEPVAKPLSRWRETEKALGISESQRKVKVGLLRLDPEEQDRVRPLPQEHAVQISRLADKEQRTELIERAAELTHREVRRAVDRLLADRELDVDGALAGEPNEPEPLTFESRLDAIADLCRQLVRALRNLDPEVSADERRAVSHLLACVDAEMTDFRSVPGNDRK